MASVEARKDSLPPHPTLDSYYGEARARERFVRDIFDRTGRWYDWIVGAMSLGSGAWYRSRALRAAGLKPGMRLLDVATGTGVIAHEASKISGPAGLTIGLDPSIGMMLAGRKRREFKAVLAVGESLPIPDQSLDFVSIGFALRHLADLSVSFSEWARVLKPGGTLMILEITRPESRIGSVLLKGYMNTFVPAVAGLRTGSAEAKKLMHYYWDTTNECVRPAEILAALQKAGFVETKREVELGIFSAYTGRR